MERFLIVLTPEEFAATEQRIEATDQPPARKREAIRAFYAMAKPISVDKQGRVVLPEEYCRKAGLTGDVVLLGGKSRFEIWSKEQWTAKENANQATYEEFAGLIGL